MGRGRDRWIGVSIGALLAVAALGATAIRLAEQGTFHPAGQAFGPAALGRLRSARPGEILSEETIADALRAHPLAWEPFLAAGQAREAQRLDGRPFLLEAVRRNPHSTAPRLALITSAALRTDMPALASGLIGLAQVAPANADALATQVGRAADTPDHARQAAFALRASPQLLASLVHGLADPEHPPALIAAMLDGVPQAQMREPVVRSALMAAFVQIGRYRQAHALWALAPASTPTPFDWQMMDGPAGSATRRADGTLELAASGRGDGLLASRLLVLPSGPSRVILAYRLADGEDSGLQVRLRCADDDRVLVSQPLPKRAAEISRLVLPAAIPADQCAGQYVEFLAQANDGNQPQHAAILRVDTEPSQDR